MAVRLLAAIFALVLVAASPAHAEKRVALVIGNAAYRNVTPLVNPRNDANDVAASLTRLNFSVNKVIDGTFDDMRRALLQFGREAVGADMAVIYYSGHGMEIGGENWLIPIDAELQSDRDAENEAIALKSAMYQVANGSSLGLVILDACRNNPFAAKMQRTVRTRSVDRGLVRVEPSDNVLVAYAAREGTVASDGDGKHSPFTVALLDNLETPGLEINFLFRAVRDEVLAATKREQQPFVYGSLSKQAIYLKAPAGTAQDVAPSNQPVQTDAAQAWSAAQGTTSQTVLESFIRRYGDSFYADLARARLEELKKSQVAVAVPPGSPRASEPQQRFSGAWLGVGIQQVTDEIANRLNIKPARGALVAALDDKSPLKPAGIELGDVIVKFDGKEIKEMRDLPRIVDDTPVGKDVDVVVLRKGKEENMTVKLGRLEDGEKRASLTDKKDKDTPEDKSVVQHTLGMQLANMSDELRKRYKIKDGVSGVVITGVDPSSGAADKRLSAGDVIIEVAQEAVSNAADVQKRIDKLKKDGRRTALLLVISPNSEMQFVVFSLQ
jgi:uncharacterized caspase-like protein